MCEKTLSETLSWLGDKLTAKRDLISKMFLRLRGFGESVGNGLLWNKKIASLMEQIAHEHEKEVGLIYEIDKIEKRHREMKQAKLLRQADARLADKPRRDEFLPCAAEEKEEEEFPFFLKAMGLFALLSACTQEQPKL